MNHHQQQRHHNIFCNITLHTGESLYVCQGFVVGPKSDTKGGRNQALFWADKTEDAAILSPGSAESGQVQAEVPKSKDQSEDNAGTLRTGTMREALALCCSASGFPNSPHQQWAAGVCRWQSCTGV